MARKRPSRPKPVGERGRRCLPIPWPGKGDNLFIRRCLKGLFNFIRSTWRSMRTKTPTGPFMNADAASLIHDVPSRAAPANGYPPLSPRAPMTNPPIDHFSLKGIEGITPEELLRIATNNADIDSILGISPSDSEQLPIDEDADPSDIADLRDRAWNRISEHLPVEKVKQLTSKLDAFIAALPPPHRRR